ncbi:NAD-dependent epimerase/dehydratase family protein [Lacticaseibacillus suihuaensis]
MPTYLITGGAGFIGGHLVARLLLDPQAQVTVVDNLSTGACANLPLDPRVTMLIHDVCDAAFMVELLDRERFDYVVLLAAVADVSATCSDPLGTAAVNQWANLTLLDVLRRRPWPLAKLFFASSAAVYGDRTATALREAGPVAPQSPYAVDKYASERAVQNAGRLCGLPVVCGRLFNVYGPTAAQTLASGGVITQAARQLAAGSAFTLHGDGEQTRDFVYVADVAAVIAALLHGPATGLTVNIGTGRASSLNQVLVGLAQALGQPLTLSPGAARPGDVRHSQADVSRLAALGLRCQTPLAQGLAAVAQAAPVALVPTP